MSIDDLSCIFSIILRVTAAQQAFSGRDDDEARESQLIDLLRRRIAITDEFHSLTMRVFVDRKELWTPLLIVFTANVLAHTGLRQLSFLLGHPVGTSVHLTDGIAFILAFFGVKPTLHARLENEVPFINGGDPVPVPEIDAATGSGAHVGTPAQGHRGCRTAPGGS